MPIAAKIHIPAESVTLEHLLDLQDDLVAFCARMSWSRDDLKVVLDGTAVMTPDELNSAASVLGVTRDSMSSTAHDWLSDCKNGPTIVATFVSNHLVSYWNDYQLGQFFDTYAHRIEVDDRDESDSCCDRTYSYTSGLVDDIVNGTTSIPADFVAVVARISEVPEEIVRYAHPLYLKNYRTALSKIEAVAEYERSIAKLTKDHQEALAAARSRVNSLPPSVSGALIDAHPDLFATDKD